MESSIGINIDETEWLLVDKNKIHTLWTAELVRASVFDQCRSNPTTSEKWTVTVTVIPTFLKEDNSYKQLPESEFCGIQQIHLTKGSSPPISSQNELSRIPMEERLNVSLCLEKKISISYCVLIFEQGDNPGEYLYMFPPTLNIHKLREIAAFPCKNVLERMLLLATSGIVHNEFESLQYLYNYCENMPLLNSTPTMIGDIALLTALELVGVTEANVSPQSSILSPVENLENRLIDTLVVHIRSKCRPKESHEKTLRKFIGNSKPILSSYMELDSVLFTPLKLKADAKVLLFSTPRLIISFFLFLVIFPWYGIRKIILRDKNFFQPDNKGTFHQRTAPRWFAFSSYIFLLLSIASTTFYYIERPDDVHGEPIPIWIPFILNLYMFVFAYMNIGAVHSKFSMPRFTSIKLSHEKARMLVIRRNQVDRTNSHLITDDISEYNTENRNSWSVNFDTSWIKEKYMNIPTATIIAWYIVRCLLALISPVSQTIFFASYRSNKTDVSTPIFMHRTVSAILTFSVDIISTESAVIVLLICGFFYFIAYFIIKGILTKVQENDYAGRNLSNEFDVKNPESLEYLLTLIRVIMGSINHSLPHLIITGCTVVVIVILAVVTLIFYIQFDSSFVPTVFSCVIYIVILAAPSIIMLIQIALINTMVSRNLLEILQNHKQRLISQITKEQSLALQQRDTTQSPVVDTISKLIRARDYLHEQIELLTSQRETNTIKLLGFVPINMPLLISIGLAVTGSVISSVVSLGK